MTSNGFGGFLKVTNWMLYRFIPLYRLYRILMFKSHFLFRNNFGGPEWKGNWIDKKHWSRRRCSNPKAVYVCFGGGARQHHLTRYFELRASSLLNLLINIMFCQKCEKSLTQHGPVDQDSQKNRKYRWIPWILLLNYWRFSSKTKCSNRWFFRSWGMKH